jgi:serine/threonine-protein kinase HipA
MADADVYQGPRLVAHLHRRPQGTSLHFLPGATLENGFLSTTLRAAEEPIESPDLHPFFLNLLPEGARLRLLLEASRSKDDSLGLLLKLGWDTIGDVAVLPPGADFTDHQPSVAPADLSQVNFWDLFHEGIGRRPDAAVPGVQEKISSSTVAFGLRAGSIPSAILKLNPENFPRLVQNEEFFLRMAKSCGLETNRAVLVEDRDGNPGLLVARFDRIKEGKLIRKLHQEDACQLLNRVPANKYSVTMREVADAIVHVAAAPIVEISRLLRLYAYSYLIGNGDLHAKNISVFWHPAPRLTPAYDLLSTLPYPLDQHMALPLEGKNDNFRSADLMRFGERYGVPPKATQNMIANLCKKAEPWISRIPEIALSEKDTERVQREIATRIEKLRR